MKISNLFKGDKVIWMVFFLLCMISIVEVFSASSGLTYKSQNYTAPIFYHVGTLVLGFLVILVTQNIPCRYFRLLARVGVVASYCTLIWVLFGGGTKSNDATRWIKILWFTVQPSEIAKGALILYLARTLAKAQLEDGANKLVFSKILWISTPLCVLIGLENLSTAVLLFGVVILMMIIARVPWQQIGKLVGVLAIIGVFVFSMIWVIGDASKIDDKETVKTEQKSSIEAAIDKILHRAGTWKARIISFSEPAPSPREYDLDKNAQVAHANIAIASCGVIGKGPGKSVERDFLSQAFSDFIYAIIVEELGIEGAFVVMFLYIILLFRTARIAGRCANNFPAFLVLGLALLLVVQAMFNMMVAVGLAPVTGQPLPLISKGGTSTVINCAYIGVILSVSKSAEKILPKTAIPV